MKEDRQEMLLWRDSETVSDERNVKDKAKGRDED